MDESPATAVWAAFFFHERRQWRAVSRLLALLTRPRGAIKDLAGPRAATPTQEQSVRDEDAVGSTGCRRKSQAGWAGKQNRDRRRRRLQTGAAASKLWVNLFMSYVMRICGCVLLCVMTCFVQTHTLTHFMSLRLDADGGGRSINIFHFNQSSKNTKWKCCYTHTNSSACY